MLGWFLCNSEFPKCKKIKDFDFWYSYMNNGKFLDDKILIDNSEIFVLLDGVIFNKKELLKNSNKIWPEYFENQFLENKFDFIKQLRGTFNGIFINKREKKTEVYVDQLGERSVFYYDSKKGDNNIIAVGSNFHQLLNFLKLNNVNYIPDIEANKKFLTYGFMVDNSTHVKEIKKIFAGNYFDINNLSEISYFKFNNKNCINCSTDSYIDIIDKTFRKAIRLELDKDIEYGYDILMDISGGMDSRTNAYVAHAMGYSNITNIAYFQDNVYERKIAENIVNDLDNDYIFKSLNNAKFIFDVDNIVMQNFGLTFYLGITGGPRLLESLNQNKFGMQHTGLLGDVYEGSFNDKPEYSKPHIEKRHQFSKFSNFKIDDSFLNQYSDQEMFSFYTRGILGGVGTHILRQNYFDTYSPFADVDVLELMFSIPLEYRINDKIYLKWLGRCYPSSLKYPYARTMCKATVNASLAQIKINMIRTKDKFILPILNAAGFDVKTNSRLTMNPTEYWVKTNPKINQFMDEYFLNNIKFVPNDIELINYFKKVQSKGSLIDKSLALTLLSVYKQYFN
ncbi:MAG: hypothetical protein RSA87_03515 [Malacoplasma sp.]